MKKNKIISMFFVTILLVIMMYLIFGIHKKNNVNNISETNNDDILTEILQDEETGEFIIYNKENGEEIARSFDKSNLRIYEIDPSYNPLIIE